MTEEQEQSNENEINEIEAPSEDAPQDKLSTQDIDVEGALAALASLHELSQDNVQSDIHEVAPNLADESTEIDEFQRIESEAQEANLSTGEVEAVAKEAPEQYETGFPRPPISALHRGQMASVIPALLMIGIGAYLTFAFTTESGIDAVLIGAILVVGFGLMLLAQWLASSRWAMGNFFIASSILLVAGTAAYLLLPTNLSFQDGYPLLLTALGTSFVLSDVFVPSGRRIWLLGLLLAIAGLAGLVITMNLLNSTITQTLGNFLPVVLVIALILIIAPIFRRRSQ